jgi:hypothetical protein
MLSTDVAVEHAGTAMPDEAVAIASHAGLTPIDVGPLSPEVDITAAHYRGNGEILFSIGSAARLSDTPFIPGDVIRWDGSSHTLVFDGTTIDPVGPEIDALGSDGQDLILSFDTGVLLDGTAYADEDLVRLSAGSFSLYFDGSAAGVPATLDVDGAELLEDGTLLLSLDGSGVIAGVTFSDEDILALDANSHWSLVCAPATWAAAFARVDTDAVTVIEHLFADGFESGDTSAWSASVP